MQIIVPMSGFGERFRRAGYSLPKPLIEVDGKPIIAHVIDLFPGETNFVFVCNQEHLDNPDYHLESTLKKYCPTGKIVGTEPHKLGPVQAVLNAAEYIDLKSPIVVNYCDFTCRWDWHDFVDFTQKTQCAGAIPAYKGFHPHYVGPNNYAYMREEHGWVLDIQEKQPYTDNRMEEYASSGTYYFASSELLLNTLHETKQQNLLVNGEYYMSMAYKPLLQAGHPVAVYEIEHFMQWGTPEDLAEYQMQSELFRNLLEFSLPNAQQKQGTIVIPMAGLGKRFTDEGYTVTKPLIPVSGLPMVIQAARDLPPANQYVFVLREDMPGFDDISKTLKAFFPNTTIQTVPQVTEGQACSALIGLDALDNPEGPITFGACDNGALYNQETFNRLSQEADVLVWTTRGHPHAIQHSHMYSWAETDGNKVLSISLKKALDNPRKDLIVIGTFTFKRPADFKACMERMQDRKAKVNGEYYLDTCINDAIALGLDCRIFEIDSYLGWGTPNDLKTFEYWQSCFDQWPSHPYDIKKDARVNQEKLL